MTETVKDSSADIASHVSCAGGSIAGRSACLSAVATRGGQTCNCNESIRKFYSEGFATEPPLTVLLYILPMGPSALLLA